MDQEFEVKLKNLRVAPRKVRLVVDMIRGKHIQDALDILKFTNKRAAPLVAKMIYSGLANAKQVATVDVDNMYISSIMVDSGPTLKRFLPRAQGRATPIRKRMSHVTIKLQEI